MLLLRGGEGLIAGYGLRCSPFRVWDVYLGVLSTFWDSEVFSI